MVSCRNMFSATLLFHSRRQESLSTFPFILLEAVGCFENLVLVPETLDYYGTE